MLEVVEVIGRPGMRVGEFCQPLGIAVDAWGHLYVAEVGLPRVQKISPEGDVWTYAGDGDQPAGWGESYDVAVDGRGTVFIVDRPGGRIVKMTSDAQYQATFGMTGRSRAQLWCPESVALDKAHTVFIADTWNNRVSVFEPNGRFEAVWRGEGIGGLDRPSGVRTTREGRVLVCDTLHHRLVVFERDGTVCRVIEGDCGGDRRFAAPTCAIEDAWGCLWVTDRGGGRIVKLDADGTVLTTFGPDAGRGLGSLGDPASLACLPDGDLYVCDHQGARILRIGYR